MVVKVGGRRLSTSNRQKPHVNAYVYDLAEYNAYHSSDVIISEAAQQESKSTSNETATPVADYPRPNPPDQNNEAPPHRQQRDDEPHKKDRQDKKVLDSVQRKMESTMPTRDASGGKGHASGIRITQPAGKAFGI